MRKFFRAGLVALFISTAFAGIARATEFAILIHREQTGCDIKIDAGTFPQGGPLVIQPTLLHIDFPEYLVASDKMITGELNPVLGADVPRMPAGSFIFNIEMTDVATGEKITQFAEPILFTIDASPPQGYDASQVCLAYLDQQPRPPQWITQDFCTAPDNGHLCGKTNHFSTFYFGLAENVPEPTSAVMMIALGSMMLHRRR